MKIQDRIKKLDGISDCSYDSKNCVLICTIEKDDAERIKIKVVKEIADCGLSRWFEKYQWILT